MFNMNRNWKQATKEVPESPNLFDDDDLDASSSDEIKVIKSGGSQTKAGHSTPIQNRLNKPDSESPDLHYNDSPIEPLTQHPPNEVGWDYNRPKDDSNSPDSKDISQTPKRSFLLAKKRNSNSPLIHKPMKKLMQEEQKVYIADFVAQLQAIQSNVKTVETKCNETQSAVDDAESQLIIETHSQPSDDSIRLQLQVSAIESPKNVDKSPELCKGIRKNLHSALCDDSMEDMMVICSQQIEEKEFGQEKNCVSKKSGHSSERINSSNLSLLKNVSSKTDSKSLEVPDDSFDNIFLEINDEDIIKSKETKPEINVIDTSNKTLSKSSNSTVNSATSSKVGTTNKFFVSKNLENVETSKTKTTSIYSYSKHKTTSKVVVQDKICNANASFGYLNKNTIHKNNSDSISKSPNIFDHDNNGKPKESKIFKAKSFTYYDLQSNKNSFMQQDEKIPRQHSMSSNISNYTRSDTNNSNSSYQDNRAWRRTQSGSSIMSRQSGVSQTLSTPEEIERKRQEAIMKRKAKLASQSLSNIGKSNKK
ncbi:hypothetical protein TKK_0001218 [Trichogramma kaykai]|uniref:Uncharacterized protein n=1 Tax=Trichogramma kaykai TaxID=54128 RepID=A0ABD2WW44_9HYME